jgi:L-lactate dehydrogenase (cytochrome)
VREFIDLVRRQVVEDLRALPDTGRRWLGGTARLQGCANIAELRALARRRLPLAVFDYVDGAANDEITAERNMTNFGLLELRPRVLVDVSEVDASCSVLGQRIELPLIGAPTGLSGLTHPDGDLALARGLHAAGLVHVLSTMASYTIEEVATHAVGPTWFQLYVLRDRGIVRELIERARAAKFQALVVTADVPRAGSRERDLRNGFAVPPRLTLRSLAEGVRKPRWSLRFVRRPRIRVANLGQAGVPGDPISLARYTNEQFDPTLDWDDMAWVREQWAGPMVVKGVLRADDARRAVDRGFDGVIVSNHGGRQLDHAVSSIGALPAVVDAVAGRLEVFLDGGVRRGTDVVKALALGARACLVGRPLLYGLGGGGQAGVARAIAILAAEVRVAMSLLGCSAVADLDRSWLADSR